MKPVMDKQTATNEIEGWIEWAEGVRSAEIVDTLLPAVMRGRVSLDENDDTFTIRLRSPVKLETGEVVESVQIREPTAAEMKKAGGRADHVDFLTRLISALSGQPLGVVERIKMKDLNVVASIVSFFG